MSMENIYSYWPLWRNSDLVKTPTAAIEELRMSAMIAFLERTEGKKDRIPTLEGEYTPAWCAQLQLT